jgi:hypothetical protein
MSDCARRLPFATTHACRLRLKYVATDASCRFSKSSMRTGGGSGQMILSLELAMRCRMSCDGSNAAKFVGSVSQPVVVPVVRVGDQRNNAAKFLTEQGICAKESVKVRIPRKHARARTCKRTHIPS